LIYSDICRLANGEKLSDPVFDTAIELLLHTQELIINEIEERSEERPAVLSSALITTASACEVFVRGFVKNNGTKLHKFIINHKKQSFSVVDLLGKILQDIPSVGDSLWAENAELGNNIRLLFDARNQSAHKGKPVLFIEHEKVEQGDDENIIRAYL
jgi:hypothetical protein